MKNNEKQPKKITLADLRLLVGKKAHLRHPSGIKFEITILNVEMHYGRPFYIISPVAGTGQTRLRENIEMIPENADKNKNH